MKGRILNMSLLLWEQVQCNYSSLEHKAGPTFHPEHLPMNIGLLRNPKPSNGISLQPNR